MMSDTGAPRGQILGLFIGTVETPWEGKPPTAIAKKRTTGPLKIVNTGFETDAQADLEVHGGVEQAIHHYACEHLPFWREQMPDISDRFEPGCFGENIATIGLNEDNLCIGDVLSLGSAKVQVTQGRQPCWKLNAHIGSDKTAYLFKKTAKTGWYYRVLETGVAAAGDFMEVLERPHPSWPISHVIKALFDTRTSPTVADTLTDLVHLSPEWREMFASRR